MYLTLILVTGSFINADSRDRREVGIPKSARKYKTKISHWDTGLLFAFDYSKYQFGRVGPVCLGSRDFTINDVFGKIACNGQHFGYPFL